MTKLVIQIPAARVVNLVLQKLILGQTFTLAGARRSPALAWKRPRLVTEWLPVLKRNEEEMEPEARPGHVWLDVRGRPLHVWAAHLEFRSGAP